MYENRSHTSGDYRMVTQLLIMCPPQLHQLNVSARDEEYSAGISWIQIGHLFDAVLNIARGICHSHSKVLTPDLHTPGASKITIKGGSRTTEFKCIIYLNLYVQGCN